MTVEKLRNGLKNGAGDLLKLGGVPALLAVILWQQTLMLQKLDKIIELLYRGAVK